MTDKEKVLPCYAKNVCGEYYVSKLKDILIEVPQPPDWFIILAKSSDLTKREWEWCFSHRLNIPMKNLKEVMKYHFRFDYVLSS